MQTHANMNCNQIDAISKLNKNLRLCHRHQNHWNKFWKYILSCKRQTSPASLLHHSIDECQMHAFYFQTAKKSQLP